MRYLRNLSLEGLGGRFDVSDIGSRPQRVVAAHTLSATSL